MNRQEVYCDSCGGEFIIETPSLLPVSFCPNCGAEVEAEKSLDDQWEDDDWE